MAYDVVVADGGGVVVVHGRGGGGGGRVVHVVVVVVVPAAARGGPAAAPGVARVPRAAAAVLLLLLSLAVLLALHPPVLEPDLDLPLRQVEVPRQLPPLLLGHVRVEEELLLQLQGLELGVGLPLLPHADVAGPVVQGVAQAGWGEEEAWKKKMEMFCMSLFVTLSFPVSLSLALKT